MPAARNPAACMKNSVRYAPMLREEYRARKSAAPQDRAAASPKSIPAGISVPEGHSRFEPEPPRKSQADRGLGFGGFSPSSAITFFRSFHTSLFAEGVRSRKAG